MERVGGAVAQHDPARCLGRLGARGAQAGVGVAIGPWQLVRDDVEAGVLVAPLGFVADGSGYHLLSPEAIREGSPEAALLAWLRAQA
jgi:DNA-binding transcriptional LysR family regulator